MSRDYWQQQAAPWVTIAVLAGGLFSSVLLFWMAHMQNTAENLTTVDRVVLNLVD